MKEVPGVAQPTALVESIHDATTLGRGDRDLVRYDAAGKPLWATGTPRNAGASLKVQNDGNVVHLLGLRATVIDEDLLPLRRGRRSACIKARPRSLAGTA